MQHNSQLGGRLDALEEPLAHEAPSARSRLGSALSLLREKMAKPLAGRGRAASARVSRERLREIIERDRALVAAQPDGDEGFLSEARAMASLASDKDLSRASRDEIAEEVGPSLFAEIERWIAEQIADLPAANDLPVTIEDSAAKDETATEPDRIRTRTMARLLASQGYRERALAIYEELVLRQPDDEGLHAEWRAVRDA